MATFQEGDIVTLAFVNGKYLLAKIVYIEDLTLHDLIHVMIYDVLIDEGPAGYGPQGEYQERTHVIPAVSGLKVAVDHLALTSTAFDDGDPLVVGHEEVTDQERRGYAVWLAHRRARMVRRGLIREEVEEPEQENEEVWEDEYEELEEEKEGDEPVDEAEEEDEEKLETVDASAEAVAADVATPGGEETIETEGGEFITIRTHTWHDTSFEVSPAQALVDLADIFRQDEFAGSPVGEAILAQTEASGEEIRELVRRLVDEGDYGAGQDLLLYGDPAADALFEALKETKDEQTASDILQILGDIGSDRAYEHIAEFFVSRIDRLPADSIAVAAARAFCYVVMLTGGTPEPLRKHLRKIERLDYPELRSDAEDAIRAIEEQGTEVPE